MKITRFGQSCILIETKKKKILIDPGYLLFEESIIEEFWKNIDVILITHKHADHCDINIIEKILQNSNTTIYASKEVLNANTNLKVNIVKENDIIDLDKIKIEVVKAVHGYMPFLKGGKEICENIGFIINDSEKRAYLTSDTICFENNYKCDIIFVPVCNHGLVMGPFEAALFAKETNASLVIPIHYDNPKYPVSMDKIREEFEKQGLNYKILGFKESIEL